MNEIQGQMQNLWKIVAINNVTYFYSWIDYLSIEILVSNFVSFHNYSSVRSPSAYHKQFPNSISTIHWESVSIDISLPEKK